MTSHASIALLLTGLLLGSTAAGKSARKRAGPVTRFVSEQALKNLECVTRWEQICAADDSRRHQLELQRTKVKYLGGVEGDVEYAILSKSRKVLQLSTPGSRQAAASLKLDKDTAVYKGPDHLPSKCQPPSCVEIPECVPAAENVTVRFVSETRLSERLRELMPLVPEKTCPEPKLEFTPSQAGETCLNTGKPYAPVAPRKKTSVSLDTQPLRLFLSNDERAVLDNESKPLLDSLQRFYVSRLVRAPRAKGTLTVRLHFPEGDRKPEVYVQQDGPRDAKLTECLSAALRSRELFPWRPSQVADLELAFVFTP